MSELISTGGGQNHPAGCACPFCTSTVHGEADVTLAGVPDNADPHPVRPCAAVGTNGPGSALEPRMDTSTAHMFTVDELRAAALEHASIPFDNVRRATSPLVKMIPDDQRVPDSTIDLVEQITGVRVPRWGGATYVTAARCRATLNRWGIRQVGVMDVRDHVRARALWSELTGPHA